MFEIIYSTHRQLVPAATARGSTTNLNGGDEQTRNSPFLLNWQLAEFVIEVADDKEADDSQVIGASCPELFLCETCRGSGTYFSIVRNFFPYEIDISPFTVERTGSHCKLVVRNMLPYDHVFDEGDWVALVQNFCMCKSKIDQCILDSWKIHDSNTKSPHKIKLLGAFKTMERQLDKITSLLKTNKCRLDCKKLRENRVAY